MTRWLLVIVPLWVTMILCTHWEPVTKDGWGHVAWHFDHGVSLASLWEVLRDDWWHANPRLGQMLTYPLYAPGPWHSIVTPPLELATFYFLTALALGRWPGKRDALAYATVFAIAALGTPEIGSMLFYRPYVGNYLFGLALSALWLVPYRLAYEQARTPRGWWAPAMLVLGAAAGNCNEHTGPAMLAVATLAIVLIARRGERVRAWMIAGLAGMLAGYLLLILAPGQHARYNGLVDAQGTLSLIASRGVGGDLWILVKPVLYLAFALPWVVIALRGGRIPRAAVGALLVAALCTLALLGSPKLGARLYLASTCFAAVAIASWVLASPSRRVLWALAGATLAFVCVRCVMVYAAIADEGARRLATLTTAPPGTHLVFHAYPDGQRWFDRDALGHDRWFNGDDFASPEQRASLAGNWHVSVTVEP